MTPYGATPTKWHQENFIDPFWSELKSWEDILLWPYVGYSSEFVLPYNSLEVVRALRKFKISFEDFLNFFSLPTCLIGRLLFADCKGWRNAQMSRPPVQVSIKTEAVQNWSFSESRLWKRPSYFNLNLKKPSHWHQVLTP